MITDVRLGNARVFEGDGWRFPLSNLTILCGSNSAGKSTILKSLLLLKQNVIGRPESSSKPVRIRLSGSQVELGTYRSFVSHRETDRELKLGLTFTNHLTGRSVSQIRALYNAAAPDPADSVRALPYAMNCDFHFVYGRGGLDTDSAPDDLDLDSTSSSGPSEAFLKSAEFEIVDLGGGTIASYSLRVQFNTLQDRFEYYLDLPESFLDFPGLVNPVRGIDEHNSRVRVSTTLRGLLPDRITAPLSGLDGSDDIRQLPLPEIIDETLSDLRRSLAWLTYVGPLRAPAERYYLSEADYNLGTDSTGKSLPYVLRDRLEAPVEFSTPGELDPVRMSLEDGLDYWLYYLRTGDVPVGRAIRKEMNIGSPQDVLVELNLRSLYGEEIHALADSGFGYSQLLPILVRGLLLPAYGTIVIEQPEAHLNPALQARLCEFLLGKTLLGSQILIETHSEHVVNYVRMRVAENERLGLADKCQILYLEKTGSLPEQRNLCIAKDGTVPEWPQSFFGDAENIGGRILRAQRSRRKDLSQR